jgi:hypothetical protein
MCLALGLPALPQNVAVAAKPLFFLPKGVSLGMSVGDLQKARPKAQKFDIPIDAEPGVAPPRVDLKKGNHTLLEDLGDKGDFRGAAYFVKDGMVVRITVSRNWGLPRDWNLNPEQAEQAVKAVQDNLRELRRKTFGECRERLGDQYKVEAVRIMLSDKVRYLLPRFCWATDDVGVAFICTGEYPGVDILEGFVGVSTWLSKKGVEPPLSTSVVPVDKEMLMRLAEPVAGPMRGTR